MNQFFKFFIITILVAGTSFKKYDSVDGVSLLKIRGIIDGSHIVTVGNLQSSAAAELVAGKDSTLYLYEINKDSAVLQTEIAFTDRIIKLHIGDANNNGTNDLLVFTGVRGYADSTHVKIYILESLDSYQKHVVFQQASPRPQPTFIDVQDMDNDGRNEIIASFYKSKYIVETVIVGQYESKWQHKTVEEKRLATTRTIGKLPGSQAIQHIAGRVYGDSIGEVGDAYILKKEGNIQLPVFRGVSSAMAIGDGDNDGENEIYVGDGWHWNYGTIARGRLATMKYRKDSTYTYELIEDIKGQQNVTQIEIADITGDGLNEVVTQGNKFFRVYKYASEKWLVFTDTLFSNHQFSIGDINGDRKADVIFAGGAANSSIEIYNFTKIDFHNKLGEEVITTSIDPKTLLNEPAPPLTISNWYGEEFKSIDNNKGKVILLDFWATWCRPCIKTFPTLSAYHSKYYDKGLRIVGITRQDDNQNLEKINKFVERQEFPYPIGVSSESFTQLSYGVKAIPHIVLIDREGIVKYYKIGASDEHQIEAKIEELLNDIK